MLTIRRTPRARVAVPAMLGSLEGMAALALAHGAAGGGGPEPVSLITFGVLVYAASWVVLRRRVGIRVVLPVLVVAQVLGHAWLVALAPAHAAAGHAGHAGTDLAGAGLADQILLGLTPSMLLAHVVAAVVTGAMWVLRRRAVDVLLQWAEPGRLPLPAGRRAVASAAAPGPRVRRDAATAPTRGPPASFVLVA